MYCWTAAVRKPLMAIVEVKTVLIAMLFLLPSTYQPFSLKNILAEAAEDASFTEPHLRTTSNIPYDVWKMHLQSTSFVQQSTMVTYRGVALVSIV